MFTHSIFLATRTILHLKAFGEIGVYFFFEKSSALVLLFFFCIDSIQMIKLTVSKFQHTKVSPNDTETSPDVLGSERGNLNGIVGNDELTLPEPKIKNKKFYNFSELEPKATKANKRYKLRIRTFEAIRRLEINYPLVEFTESNFKKTKKNENKKNAELRLELPLYRLKTALSYILLVVFWALPFAALMSIVILEVSYFIAVVFLPKSAQPKSIIFA